MAVVAVVVCGFAVGMAGLLDYFKYRKTAEQLVEQRLKFIGQSIENSIQSSLAVGLQFADIGTLAATLERERAADGLILTIDVFDSDGRVLYSTDPARVDRPAPQAWQIASRKAGSGDWAVREGGDAAVGNSVQNNFGLPIGDVALRYSSERVQAAALGVARQLALNAFLVFLVASALATFALSAVMRRLERDIGGVEHALRAGDAGLAAVAQRRSPFGPALQRFIETVRQAESQIVELRARLQRGARP